MPGHLPKARWQLYPLTPDSRRWGLVFLAPAGHLSGRRVVSAFLAKATETGVWAPSPIVGHIDREGLKLAVLADGRRALAALVAAGHRVWATDYAVLPDRDSLARWYTAVALAGGIPGWAGELLTVAGSGSTSLPRPGSVVDPHGVQAWLSALDRGVHWCPACGGLNPHTAARCLWCGYPLCHLTPV